MLDKPQLVLDAKAELGEGPSWDEKNQVLYWVDILRKCVHIYNPQSGADRIVQLDQYVGAAVVRESGGLVLALQHGFYTLNPETEELHSLFDPESALNENRFNDGKCDAAGRFWAGTMSFDETGGKGSLYCLDLKRQVTKKAEGISVSNGMSWSPDFRKMYYIDSPTRQVAAYDFNLETGEISNKSIIICFSEDDGFPDGMTGDEEGMLWIAHWGGYKVTRWNPQAGQLIDTISLPTAKVTSCVFGGMNLDELYITTARIGLEQTDLESQHSAGGLFRVKTKVKGLKTYAYKG